MKKLLTITILSFLLSINVSATEERWVRLLSGEDPDYDFSERPLTGFEVEHAMRDPDTLQHDAEGSSEAAQPVDIPGAGERLKDHGGYFPASADGYFPASAVGSFPGTTPPDNPISAGAGAKAGEAVRSAQGGGYSKKSLRKKRKKRTKRTQNKTKKKRTKKKRTKKRKKQKQKI